MNKSESIKELATALAKAQGEMENANKNSANPHFKSKYADLAEVLNTVRPVLSKHGLAIVQLPSFEGGIVSVETALLHSSGEWLSGVSSAPVSKQDAQGVGSAITYLRRYSAAAAAGIAQEDDDGNAAVGQTTKPACLGKAISGKQLGELRDLLAALNRKEAPFAAYLKLESLDKLPEQNFESVKAQLVTWLNAEKEKQK